MALLGDSLYVANTDGVLRFPYRPGQTRIDVPGPTTLALGGPPAEKSRTVSSPKLKRRGKIGLFSATGALMPMAHCRRGLSATPRINSGSVTGGRTRISAHDHQSSIDARCAGLLHAGGMAVSPGDLARLAAQC
jgi:hypothetical protein